MNQPGTCTDTESHGESVSVTLTKKTVKTVRSHNVNLGGKGQKHKVIHKTAYYGDLQVGSQKSTFTVIWDTGLDSGLGTRSARGASVEVDKARACACKAASCASKSASALSARAAADTCGSEERMETSDSCDRPDISPNDERAGSDITCASGGPSCDERSYLGKHAPQA